MSKRDNEIIAQYLSGEESADMRETAAVFGGIARVEGGRFIMANGDPVEIKSKSLFERWAEEEKIRPADWFQVVE